MLPLLFAAAATMPGAQLMQAVAHAPASVRAVIDRRAGCNHWRGEEPYDRARAREINAAMRRLGCDRLPADARALRRRYARQAAILALLDATADWDGGQ